MMHDFATHKKTQQRQIAPRVAKTSDRATKPPFRVAVIAALVTTVAVGALGFSHVVSAVGADLNETIAEAAARKDAERALKAQRAAEKLELADAKRLERQITKDKEKAERSAGYDFYEDLAATPWPVPVASDAYTNNTVTASAAAKEDTSVLPYSLQVALYRDEKEALNSQRTLAKLGYSSKVDSIKVKAGGVLYQVTLGPITGLEKATHVREKLQEHNYFAQVYRE